jgi:hypothetical protein
LSGEPGSYVITPLEAQHDEHGFNLKVGRAENRGDVLAQLFKLEGNKADDDGGVSRTIATWDAGVKKPARTQRPRLFR